MREAMSMQQLLDQIAEQLPDADEEPADASDLRRDSAAVASQMPSAAEAAEWATAGKGELEATPLSLANIRAQAKTMLAAKTTPAARQETLAALADAALRAARPHSAALIFEMAERRAWKVQHARPRLRLRPRPHPCPSPNPSSSLRPSPSSSSSPGLGPNQARAQGKTGGAVLSRELLRVGLLAQVALRQRRSYEALLRHAQQGWELELAEEPRLLSAAMEACCEAGWLQHALACNETLSASGQTAGIEAHKALMAARLRQGDSDGAIDVFVHMRSRGSPPDHDAHALAMRAAATRKTSWKGLQNLMRRKWLKIAWNPTSANAALSAMVEHGNLRAAADVLATMGETKMPLEAMGLEAVLCAASASRRTGAPESVLALSALQRLRVPLSATACLAYLPCVQPAGRLAFLQRGLREGGALSSEWALLQAAAALQLATLGRGEECAARLAWLEDEGADLQHVSARGELARIFAPTAPLSSEEAGEAAGGLGDEVGEAEEMETAEEAEVVAGEGSALEANLWLLAVRACPSVRAAGEVCAALGERAPPVATDTAGTDATTTATATAATTAATTADTDAVARIYRAALLEMMETCRRAGDAVAVEAVLRRLGSSAPPEAYLRLVQVRPPRCRRRRCVVGVRPEI